MLSSNLDVMQLPFNSIVLSNENERYILSDIKQLIDSIKEIGLQVPLIVHRIGKDKYEVVDGHRRYKALEQLNFKLIPCIVYNRKLSEDELVAIRNSTDAYHVSWSAYDKLKLFVKLSALGLTQQEIAKKMNLPLGDINCFANLSSLPDHVIKYAAKNNVPYTYVYKINTDIATRKMCKKLSLEPEEIVMKFIEKWIKGSVKSRERAAADGKKLYYLNKDDALYWLSRDNLGLEVLDALAKEKGLVVEDEQVINKSIETINRSCGQFIKLLRDFPKAKLNDEQKEKLRDNFKLINREYKNLMERLRHYLK